LLIVFSTLTNNISKISILFFAAIRERAGTDVVRVVAVDGMTVGDAVDAACKAIPGHLELGTVVMLALNGDYVARDHLASPGDEIAVIPPVSGGADEIADDSEWVFLTSEDLDSSALTEFVKTNADGAIATFLGVTRDSNQGRIVKYLEYEAYQPMAQNKMVEIIEEMRSRWSIGKIAVAHRTGRVNIGETSMVIAVASPHRRPAFEACLYFVDRLKEIVPIWKKEFFEGGEVWIGKTPGDGTVV